MALSKKITQAVKDAQKQAEAAVADVRGQLVQVEGRMPDVQVDPTPFYAVVGAANIAIDTVRTAGEQLEVARRQAKGVDLRKGAKKEANQLQKDLQKRIVDLQNRTAELQKLATTYAERFVTQAQDLPARVLNEGLVIASNAKDQYDAAAARGEKVVTDLRAQGERTAFDLSERGTATVTRGRRVAGTAVTEGEKVAKSLMDVVAKDASKIGSQVGASVDAVESAAAPVPARAHRRAPAGDPQVGGAEGRRHAQGQRGRGQDDPQGRRPQLGHDRRPQRHGRPQGRPGQAGREEDGLEDGRQDDGCHQERRQDRRQEVRTGQEGREEEHDEHDQHDARADRPRRRPAPQHGPSPHPGWRPCPARPGTIRGGLRGSPGRVAPAYCGTVSSICGSCRSPSARHRIHTSQRGARRRPVVAHVVRGGFVESVHHGTAVVTAPDGSVSSRSATRADPSSRARRTSRCRPLAMLRAGLATDGACWPSPAPATPARTFHLDGVRARSSPARA